MGPEDVAELLDVVNLGVIGLVLALWLTGKLTRPADCDERVAAADARAAAAEAERDAAVVDAARNLELFRHQQVEAEAWREVATIEADSRRHADSQNAQLMEQSRVSLELVGTLRDWVAQRAKDGDH